MCTSITHSIKDANSSGIFTGRNLDWYDSAEPNIWFYPKGLSRDGAINAESPYCKYEASWVSKYNSVTVSIYEFATCDGVNEKGLTAGLLWLGESIYPSDDKVNEAIVKSDGRALVLSLSIWPQYMLDRCANVAEAIESMCSLYVRGVTIPDAFQREAGCHLVTTDVDGYTAFFEYDNGYLNIHSDYPQSKLRENLDLYQTYHEHTRDEMKVIANSPVFSDQLALNRYWQLTNSRDENKGFPIHLPGSNASPARFVRASHYVNRLSEDTDSTVAIAGVLSVMRNVAQPVGVNPPKEFDEPNEYPTWYTTISSRTPINDGLEVRYFYQALHSPYMIWFDFTKCGLNQLSTTHKLALNNLGVAMMPDNKHVAGDAVSLFKPSKPFEFRVAC